MRGRGRRRGKEEREREERNANLTPLSEHGCEESCPVTPASV